MDSSPLPDIKSHPVNSSHYSPYKNYLKQGTFAKKEGLPSTEDTDIRAKALLKDMNYHLGRVRAGSKTENKQKIGRMAPGPAIKGKNYLVAVPDVEIKVNVEGNSVLEKGFERVKVKIPAINRSLIVSKPSSTSPKYSSQPFLSSADKSQLQESFRSRLHQLKAKLQHRATVELNRANGKRIFPPDVNQLRANSSLNSALEHE